jgi:hypothetical protein
LGYVRRSQSQQGFATGLPPRPLPLPPFLPSFPPFFPSEGNFEGNFFETDGSRPLHATLNLSLILLLFLLL